MAEDRYQMALLSYFAKSFARVDEFVYNYEKRNESSIMAQNDSGKVLKKQKQYLNNWLGIYRFYSNKERDYYELAARQTISYAQLVMKSSLKFGDRSDFQYVINILDQFDPNYWCEIGWSDTGLKGIFYHSYICMKGDYFRERVIRKVRKLFN